MARVTWAAVLALVVVLSLPQGSSSCGVLTHIEIGHRASFYFDDKPGSRVSYKTLIEKHQDAFQAGNPYPDAMYPSLCYDGNYHQVAEDTHWTPFMVATIDYIREKYPQPWNETAEKLVVFLLGFTSHQIADVLWHNLGVEDGFLQAMANANYHGDFSSAHPVGDFGGDVVGAFEWNKSYVEGVQWYVPTEDLQEIYKRYYASQHEAQNVSSAVIATCSRLLFLARLGEKTALAKLFPDYAKKSPFLVEELNEYFTGGVDDNAAWTTLLWHDAITMLESGSDKCNHSKNPVNTHCPSTEREALRRRDKGLRSVPPKFLNILDNEYAEVEHVDRGIVLRPSAAYYKHVDELRAMLTEAQQETSQHQSKADMALSDAQSVSPSGTYTTSVPYSRLGWALASADFNGDSYPDLAIGAPGFSRTALPQSGCVYVVFGTSSGLPHNGTADISNVASIRLDGSVPFGRFGKAIAALDFNLDGFVDLAVGAPSAGTAELQYIGAVHIFFNSGKGQFPSTPSITIPGSNFHENFGWSMAAGDMNLDGAADLIVSAPFLSTSDLSEAGRIAVYMSTKNLTANSLKPGTEMKGPVWNGWFGHSLSTAVAGGQSLLAIGSPNLNLCKTPMDCSHPTNADIQSVGELDVFAASNDGKLAAVRSAQGNDALDKCGTSASMGRFLAGVDVLAIACPTADIKAHVLGVPVTLNQAGRVYLFNLTSNAPSPFAALEGDRSFGRFGWSVSFSDVTGDNFDDLVITMPMRINDITEVVYGSEQGTVYVFEGGSAFTKWKGPYVTNDCGATVESPCPAHIASMQLDVAEANSRFGSSVHMVQDSAKKSKAVPVVGAVHSNRGSRMSGSVYVF